METIAISKEEYETLIALVGRANALRDFVKAKEYVNPVEVLAILGFLNEKGESENETV